MRRTPGGIVLAPVGPPFISAFFIIRPLAPSRARMLLFFFARLLFAGKVVASGAGDNIPNKSLVGWIYCRDLMKLRK